MKVLLFTHKNDIDGMGNAILAQLAFSEVDYELCGTFDLTSSVESYFEGDKIYQYDRIYVTDLCLEDPVLSKVAMDSKLEGKVKVFDHHKTFADPKYTSHNFVTVRIEDEDGLCCGTSLFYKYLVSEGLIDKDNKCISEFVELTRQHDTWEWRNIYNNEKARELSILFDALGYDGYISLMTEKLRTEKIFDFNSMERILIDNRKKQISLKCEYYKDKIIYKDILGMRAGIVFITYEYRNELAEYFRENKFDMDFTMMIALDPGVVAYRSVRDGKAVRPVAELFGGKGHDKAATNPITDEMISKILEVLTK